MQGRKAVSGRKKRQTKGMFDSGRQSAQEKPQLRKKQLHSFDPESSSHGQVEEEANEGEIGYRGKGGGGFLARTWFAARGLSS